MSGTLLTELQSLAQRLHDDATTQTGALAEILNVLGPDTFAAAHGMALPVPATNELERRLVAARAMQFDAARVLALANKQADESRALYTATMGMVDTCRFARSSKAGGRVVCDAMEERLADLQELIAAQFPGETIPGG